MIRPRDVHGKRLAGRPTLPHRTIVKDGNGHEIAIALGKGGVTVTVHQFNNLIRPGCSPLPPPEIMQKLYPRRQVRTFVGEEARLRASGLGLHDDLQSLHREDAKTWSVFGIAFRAPRTVV